MSSHKQVHRKDCYSSRSCYHYHHQYVVGTPASAPSTKLCRRTPGATHGYFPGCPKVLRVVVGGVGKGGRCSR